MSLSRNSAIAAASVLLAGAVMGCGNKSSGEPAPAAAQPSGSAASSAAAAKVEAPEKPAAKGDFGVVARSPDEFILYPLKGNAFVDAAGFLALLGDGPIKQSPAAMKGLEKGASGKILGAFPEGAWLLADVTYKWVNDRWAKTDLLREGESFLDIAAWGDSRAIAAIAMPNNDMRFFLVGGKSGVLVPAPAGIKKDPKPVASAAASASATGDEAAPPAEDKPAEDKPAEVDKSCKVKMKPDAMALAGLPTGELYAAGYECQEVGKGAPIVERWEPKKLHGTVEPLPKAEGAETFEIHGVLARSPTEVWVYGGGAPQKAYLARWDGKAWSKQAIPIAGTITSLSAAEDGTLWAAVAGSGGSELWKRPASSEAFTAVALDPVDGGAVTAQAVFARTATDVWVTAKTAKGTGLLLRSGPAKDAVDLPSRSDMSKMVSTNRRWIATPACDKVYAHLYTVGASNGEVPKDFSAIKEIFSQKEFADLAPIVEDDGANLYVGSPVPSLAVGQALLAAYRAKNPKAVPNLFCHEPVIIKKAIKFQ